MKKIIFSILISFSLNVLASSSYRVNHGTSQDINEFATCKKVSNAHASSDYFIPTNSSAEWSAFYNLPPTGVTIGTCGESTNVLSFGFEDASWGGFDAWSSAPDNAELEASYARTGSYGMNAWTFLDSMEYGDMVRKQINYRAGSGSAWIRCVDTNHVEDGMCKAYIDATEIGSVTIPAANEAWHVLNFTFVGTGTGFFSIRCQSTYWEYGGDGGADLNYFLDDLSIPVQ